MSYDFCMTIDTGGEEPATVESGLNITYNVAPMFVRAFKFNNGIHLVNGIKGKDASNLISLAIGEMERDADAYVEMEPKNKWGTYRGALSLLQNLLEWCKRHPKAKLEIH